MSRRHPKSMLWLALAWSCLCASAAFGASPFAERVRRDTEWFAAGPTRLTGTAAHGEAIEALLRETQRICDDANTAANGERPLRVWADRYPVVMPHTIEATLDVADGPWHGQHPVYPMWPASSRLNTTPDEGIAGRIIYVGDGNLDAFPAHSLRGQIAAIEAHCGENWRNAGAFGAAAVLFLGSRDETQLDARYHEMWLPVNLPRIYLPRGEVADAIRSGEIAEGRLLARAQWREATATNIYALIPSRELPTTATAQRRKAFVIAVQSDAMSCVPDLAPGADAAVDTAVALGLLRHWADEAAAGRRPEHPILIAFLDAFSVNMKGIRHMLGTLAVDPYERRDDLKEDRKLLEEYETAAQLLEELGDGPDAVRRIHQVRFKPLHSAVKDEAALQVVDIDNVLQPKRLATIQAGEDERARLEREIEALAARRTQINAARSVMLKAPKRPWRERLFSGTTSGTLVTLNPQIEPMARDLLDRARARIDGQQAEVNERLDRVERRDALRIELLHALGLTTETQTGLGFLLGLDLSDSGVAVGPNTSGRFYHNWDTSNADEFVDWLAETERQHGAEVWPDALSNVISLEPYTTDDAKNTFIVGEVAMFTAAAGSFDLPNVSWATLDALRRRVDTPHDRADRLDWGRLAPQIDATVALIRRLVDDAEFNPTNQVDGRWRRVEGSIVDQAPGEPLARLPREGYLASLIMADSAGFGAVQSGRYWPRWWLSGIAGMRHQEFVFSGSDGGIYFDDMAGTIWDEIGRVSLQAHKIASDGRIVGALDLRKSGKGVHLQTWQRLNDATPLRGVVFPCDEMSAFHNYDPRFLIELAAATVLDARRNGLPQRLNFAVCDGMAACLMEPDVRWQMLLRVGIAEVRMLLLNVAEDLSLDEHDALGGFALDAPLPLHPVHAAARDVWRLDHRRLENYRRAGITSRGIDRLHQATSATLAAADRHLARDDGGAMFHAAAGALANEVRAYKAIRALGNDVVRAAIFLLLALIPFAYAMERLLIASPYIFRQILGGLTIFTVMTAILVWFHPAFKISGQPLIIIMAFGIIFMSLLVIGMVYMRFKANIEEMKSVRAESSGARTSRLGLLTNAVKLGLANMRKRKLRTALTSLTIILITFCLLCFTSASRYEGRKSFEIKTDRPPSFTGVLIRQPSQRALVGRAVPYLDNVLNHFGDGRLEASYRYWWLDPWQRRFRAHVRNPANGRQVSMEAALGLGAREDAFTDVADVLPDWPRFAKLARHFGRDETVAQAGGDLHTHGGCYLDEDLAAELEVEPGDTVVVAGAPLELVGVYDGKRFDKTVTGMDGRTITPLDYAALPDSQRFETIAGDWDMTRLSNEMASGAGLEPTQDLPHISAARTIIVPAALLKNMRDCTLRSITIRTDTVEQAVELAHDLTDRFAFPIYYGSPETGVQLLATTPLLPKAPRSMLIVLAIAGLIIFNTMMSSIAERKNEIYIYTSLGLAPLHIGALFLAEAVTYGLMGSIFGYVVGQGLATVLSHTGLLGSMTLNYSGSQAVITMALVMVVVVVSSLIPAFLAGRLAVPSNEMTWRVPQPTDGVIRDMLPFTVTPHTADGTMVYLADYFEAHREGSIGNFTTDRLEIVPAASGDGDHLTLNGTVWVAPYDLGVRQDFEITLHPPEDAESGESGQDAIADVLNIAIALTHGAGQTGNWIKLNKTFLGDLRRQLLGWRDLKTERILAYIVQARQMGAEHK